MRSTVRHGLADVRRLVRRAGVDVVRYPVHTTLEGHLRWLVARHGVTTLLDVGANEGQFAARQLEAGFDGRIESFEPTPSAYAALADRAAPHPRWRTHQLALGDRDGEATLHQFPGSVWNSLHEPDAEHLRAAGRSLVSTGSIDVTVRRLDSIWPEVVGAGDVAVLKVDAQGHDLAIVEGAGERLSSLAAILLEGSVTTFYEGEPDLVAVLQRLAELGFTPSGFFAVTRRRGSLALDTVDVCFVPTP